MKYACVSIQYTASYVTTHIATYHTHVILHTCTCTVFCQLSNNHCYYIITFGTALRQCRSCLHFALARLCSIIQFDWVTYFGLHYFKHFSTLCLKVTTIKCRACECLKSHTTTSSSIDSKRYLINRKQAIATLSLNGTMKNNCSN